MNTAPHPGRHVSEQIAQAMSDKKISRKALYDAANITRETFDRRMASGQGWTIDELTAIADRLDLPAWSLLPYNFTTEVAA